MSLSQTERLVFQVAQHQADLSIPEVGRLCKIRSHVARRCLERLRETGIVRKIAFIDPYVLGSFEARVFLAVRHTEKRVSGDLCAFLRKENKVGYVGEVGGEYQLSFSYWAVSIADLHLFVDELSRRFGQAIRASAVSIITRSQHLGVRYLLPKGPTPREIVFSTLTRAVPSLDELDLRLLWRIAERPELRLRELGREQSCSESTTQFRVARLRREGVLRGFGLRLGSIELGLHTSYMLLSVRGHRAQIGERLLRFARSTSHILAIQECIGNWDFSLVVQGEEPHVAIAVSQRLDELMGSDIVSVRILPSYRVQKLFFRLTGVVPD